MIRRLCFSRYRGECGPDPLSEQGQSNLEKVDELELQKTGVAPQRNNRHRDLPILKE